MYAVQKALDAERFQSYYSRANINTVEIAIEAMPTTRDSRACRAA